MPRSKKHSAEQIIAKLRTAEVEMSKGRTTAQAAKNIGVTEQTYYRWRKEYGGLRTDQAKRLKTLEKENARLKRLLADAAYFRMALSSSASASSFLSLAFSFSSCFIRFAWSMRKPPYSFRQRISVCFDTPICFAASS